MVDSELISIVRLFPDEDAPVQTAVNEGLLERGDGVLADLKELMSDAARLVEISRGTGADAAKMRKMISSRFRYVSREFSFRRLERICDDDYPSLDEAFLIISRIVNPSIDEEEFVSRVNSFAGEFASEINDRQTAVEQTEIFNHIFFHRLGFRCGDSPAGSGNAPFLIPDVLSTRRGTLMCILLVYFMMSRYAGIEVYPMVFRGGLIPVILEGGKVLFFLDMNHGGKIIHQDDFFASLAGMDVDAKELEAREDRILPVLYLESLETVFNERRDEYGPARTSFLLSLSQRALSMFGPERFIADSADEEDEEEDD